MNYYNLSQKNDKFNSMKFYTEFIDFTFNMERKYFSNLVISLKPLLDYLESLEYGEKDIEKRVRKRIKGIRKFVDESLNFTITASRASFLQEFNEITEGIIFVLGYIYLCYIECSNKELIFFSNYLLLIKSIFESLIRQRAMLIFYKEIK